MSVYPEEGVRETVKVEGGRDEAAKAITGGILGQALAGGFAVQDEVVEAVKQANEPAPEPEVQAEPPPDPVEAIVENLQAEQEAMTEDVSPAMEEVEDDEIQVPDFEAEAEKELLDEEIAASGEEGYADEEWGIDPEVNEARKRALVAEKKAAYYERITAQREQKKWEAEADKHYPMWRARGEIKANSKRGFLRAAKESHEAVKPFVTAAVKTREQQLEEQRASLKAEAKQEAAEAWGKPTVATHIQPDGARDFEAEWNKARANQDLPNMLRIRREQRAAQGGEPSE